MAKWKRRMECIGCGMAFMTFQPKNQTCGVECYALMYFNAGIDSPAHRQVIKLWRRKGERKFWWQEPIWELVAGFKLTSGCVDCGYNKHPTALQFDHVSGVKERNISKIRSVKILLREIGKCEVVCANCHSIRTYNRLQVSKKQRADRRATIPKLAAMAILESVSGIGRRDGENP